MNSLPQNTENSQMNNAITIFVPDDLETTLYATDAALIQLSENAREQTLTLLDTQPAIKNMRDARDILKALDVWLKPKMQTRANKIEASNNLKECILRLDRATGAAIADMQSKGLLNGGEHGGDAKSTSAMEVDSYTSEGVTHKQAYTWKLMASLPTEDFESTVLDAKENGLELTAYDIQKKAKKYKKKAAQEIVPTNLPAANDRYRLMTGDIAELLPTLQDGSFDAIITDPPYPHEYLHVYKTLAIHAGRLLKPGGSLLVMCGQSYLPEVLALMTPHIQYAWTLTYLTPGGQAAQIWQRKVNTFWKPVLWFTNGKYDGDWIGDVLKSDVNDNDKRFHEWGQSESGIADIMTRFTYPGQHILDPFLGGGTTAVVSLRMNRLFTGIDINPDSIQMTLNRIEGLNSGG